MPTIKTIKPAGGGDYTVLSVWWVDASGAATADQWAECYSGGSLGSLLWFGGPTSDETHYQRVYVADGEGHNGSLSAGAYTDGIILGGNDYARLEGLRVHSDNFQAVGPASTMRVDSVIVHGGGGFFISAVHDVTLTNCLSVGGVGSYGIELDSGAFNVDILNCTVYGSDNGGIRVRFGCTLRLLQNTVCASNATDIISNTSITTSSNNASSDGTADDFGGSGNLVNQTDTDLFTAPGSNNFSVKAGSALIGAGTDLSGSFTDDIAGNTRTTWDIGAYSYATSPTISTVKPAGAGDYTTLAAWWSARRVSGSANEWAECYSGGDLGDFDDQVTMTATPDATHYPKIYVAPGHGHGGDPTAGAYSSGDVNMFSHNYWQAIGLRLTAGSGGKTIQCAGVGFVLEGIFGTHNHKIIPFAQGSPACYVRNCIMVKNDQAFDLFCGADLFIENCTAVGSGQRGFQTDICYAGTVTVRNCVAVGYSSGNGCFDLTAFGATVVATNNASSDGTADDFGGTGHLTGLDPDDLFTDADGGDFSLKAGSDLIDAGADLSGSFTTDIRGLTRPAGAAFDIGAFEVQLTQPAASNVRAGVSYTTLPPAASDVRSGVSFGWENAMTVGTCAVPVAGNVRSGINVDAGVGTLALPAAADVESGVQYGAAGTEYTGTFAKPVVGNVRSGVQYGGGGNEFTGACAVPAVGNVKLGVNVDAGTGTLELPAENDVREEVGYGADGEEFEGTLAATADASTLPAEEDVRYGTEYGGDLSLVGTLVPKFGNGNMPNLPPDEFTVGERVFIVAGEYNGRSGTVLAALADNGYDVRPDGSGRTQTVLLRDTQLRHYATDSTVRY